MPRPKKWRKICTMPGCKSFAPNNLISDEAVVMSVDEYETVRLIDYEGFTQEQCAKQMEVARTTVQAMYASARHKLAKCIVLGFQMTIEGGEYQICEQRRKNCGHICCRRESI